MNRFRPISERLDNSVEEMLGKMISEYFSLNLDRQQQKNLGVILSNFMDFGDYMNIAIELKKENGNMKNVLSIVRNALSAIDPSEIAREIADFAGKEESGTYLEIVNRLRNGKK